MTSQQFADNALQQWQANRALPPDQRIEMLMFDFWLPPSITEVEYEAQLRRVQEAMQ